MNFRDTYKNILSLAIFAVLCIPFYQSRTHYFTETKLDGDIPVVTDTMLTPESWFSERYQLKKQKFINDSFPLRGWAVRLTNQFYYDILRDAKANGVIIGKDDYLFEYGYIDAYYGGNYSGAEKIADNVRKYKMLQDTLRSMNIQLLLVFEPGKGSFYNEYIPDHLRAEKRRTNYEEYSLQLKKAGADYVDMFGYFLSHKPTSAYPLYPKTGTHWSVYGATIATDTIAHVIQRLRKVPCPQLHWLGIDTSDIMRETDDDIEKGCNLLFPIRKNTMAYPRIDYDTVGRSAPKVMTIADSYFWNIFGSGHAARLWRDPEFWFYYRQVYRPGLPPADVSSFKLKEEIEKNDVVLVMTTESTLDKFGWGFIDDAYKIYFENDTNEYDRKVKHYISSIRTNPDWLKSVKAKAADRKISVDSMLVLDAQYMADQDLKEKK